MLVVIGSVGLGLVWGWVAARLIYHARWTVVVRVLLGLVAQGLVVLQLASPRVLLWFGGATAIGALVCLTWVRTLEARYLE
jgi:hypothetical protein